MILVLDAGVVIAVGDANDVFHEAAMTALRTRTSADLILPASAYAEALVGPMRRGGEAAARLDAALAAGRVAVQPADRRIAAGAARLRAAHPRLRLPDALVLATAEAVTADEVLTTDARWPAVDIPVTVLDAGPAGAGE